MDTLDKLEAQFLELSQPVEILHRSLDHLRKYELNHSYSFPNQSIYKPQVHFVIAYDDDHVALKFYVSEDHVKATLMNPQDPVYTESCVEFFVEFVSELPGFYINLEFNAIGTVLSAKGPSLSDRTPISKEMIDQIKKYSSLGTQPVEYTIPTAWELTFVVPRAYFGIHTPLSKVKMNCNVYKCGDDLSKPHWLSYYKIITDKPDFHRPEYFGPLLLKK